VIVHQSIFAALVTPPEARSRNLRHSPKIFISAVGETEMIADPNANLIETMAIAAGLVSTISK
jgi:hypothetical protein